MTFVGLSPWANHLWQSTLFAAVAWLLTLMLRKNRAAVRYWIWLAASAKFLIPFGWLAVVGASFHWRAAAVAGTVRIPVLAAQIGQPFEMTVPVALPSAAAPVAHLWPVLLLSVWLCGIALGLVFWVRSHRRMDGILRGAKALDLNLPIPVMAAPGRMEPGVFGIWKPVLLLPEGITERLTPGQLEAILAHELRHVHRRDNLTAAIHMLVETVFWFHPAVWWIRTRLVEERERACDEGVLQLGSEPQVYAESILKVCEFYLAAPVAFAAGVTGGELKKRIEGIMTGGITRELNSGQKLILAAIGLAALAAPIVIGVLTAPAIRAQVARGNTPKFEVASVKPCNGDEGVPEGGGGRAGSGGGGPASSPGRLRTACMPVRFFIETAYVHFANARRDWNPDLRLVGGPDWINSASYQINAIAADNTSQSMMSGPMLQKLLEDRFQLRIHREARKVPVYELVVAKQGFKLTPTDGRSCTARDLTQFPPPLFDPSQKQACGTIKLLSGPHKVTFDLPGATVTEFSKYLPDAAGRPVIDKTGIAGLFDFHIEFAREGVQSSEPSADNNDAPSVFSALAQIGLRLQPARGSKEFLVIDSVARPSEN